MVLQCPSESWKSMGLWFLVGSKNDYRFICEVESKVKSFGGE